MSYSALIRHSMGMSPGEITAEWTADPATLPDVLAGQRRRLTKSVLRAMKWRANEGDMAAVEWVESQASTSGLSRRGSPGLSQHSVAEVQGIIEAAIRGKVDSAEWLQSKGLLDMSLGKE